MEKVTTPEPKTAVITLHASGNTLVLMATRKADGSAITNATTRDTKKVSTRGMTERHENMAAAKAHLAVLAERAAKLGWQRAKPAGLQPRPDAFSKLPAPPKAGAQTSERG